MLKTVSYGHANVNYVAIDIYWHIIEKGKCLRYAHAYSIRFYDSCLLVLLLHRLCQQKRVVRIFCLLACS